MTIEETKYNLQKVATDVMINPMFEDFGTDFITKQLRARMSAYIAQRLLGEKEVTVSVGPPSFLDWLLRRKKTRTIRCEAKAVFSDAENQLRSNEVLWFDADEGLPF